MEWLMVEILFAPLRSDFQHNVCNEGEGQKGRKTTTYIFIHLYIFIFIDVVCQYWEYGMQPINVFFSRSRIIYNTQVTTDINAVCIYGNALDYNKTRIYYKLRLFPSLQVTLHSQNIYYVPIVTHI